MIDLQKRDKSKEKPTVVSDIILNHNQLSDGYAELKNTSDERLSEDALAFLNDQSRQARNNTSNYDSKNSKDIGDKIKVEHDLVANHNYTTNN